MGHKVPATGKQNYYLSSGGQTSSSHGISLYQKSSGDLCVSTRTTTTKWEEACFPAQRKVWMQITFVWSNDTGLMLFSDGALRAQINGTSWTGPTKNVFNKFFIGKPNNQDKMFGQAFIDELVFWNYALAEDEVESSYLNFGRYWILYI